MKKVLAKQRTVTFFASLALAAILVGGCTGPVSGHSDGAAANSVGVTAITGATAVHISVTPPSSTASTISSATADQAAAREVAIPASCSRPEFAGEFTAPGSAPASVDVRSVAPGLYMASVVHMAIEKTNGVGRPPSRILVRQIVGGDRGGEIACADELDSFGYEFDFSMTGLVKFVLNDRGTVSDFVYRQVFFYQNQHQGRVDTGAIFSNPGLSQVAWDPQGRMNLAVLLQHGWGHLSKTGEQSYQIRYLREREGGVKARLSIDLQKL